jgi:hypothetical protein
MACAKLKAMQPSRMGNSAAELKQIPLKEYSAVAMVLGLCFEDKPDDRAVVYLDKVGGVVQILDNYLATLSSYS